MSKLLVDAGNTRIKTVLLLDEAEPVQYQAFSYTQTDWLQQLQQSLPSAPTQIWLASVSDPQHREALHQLNQQHWQAQWHELEAERTAFGLKNAYTIPAKLGVDRWLAMIAAWQQHQQACLVVSAGTAMTIDAIDNSGQHLGGLIAPGFQASLQALQQQTQLQWQSATPTASLANNTDEAMINGIYYALSGSLNKVYQELSEQMNASIKIFLSGGDASLLSLPAQAEYQQEPQLVLQGLAHYARQR